MVLGIDLAIEHIESSLFKGDSSIIAMEIVYSSPCHTVLVQGLLFVVPGLNG